MQFVEDNACQGSLPANYGAFRSVSKMEQRMSLDETILSADALTIFDHCSAAHARPFPS
jgi:hypothetical protein